MTTPALANCQKTMLQGTMTSLSTAKPAPNVNPSADQDPRDYDRIAQTIRYLMDNRLEQPELALIASQVGLSEFHFQRLFTRWVGISPKKFLQHLTLADAKKRLAASASVLDATFDVGLSGPGRLHDLFINLQQVTPGEYKSRGAGLAFQYAFHPTPFGECLVVANERGLTGLSFVINGNYDACLAEQKQGWDQANWTADPQTGVQALKTIFALGASKSTNETISVFLRGTTYQVRVWEALLKIPVGCVTTYGNLSDKLGTGTRAARAVGNACGANRIGVLIPCHRVIRDSGAVSGYRWGTERKKALLAFEAAMNEAPEASRFAAQPTPVTPE